MPEIHDAIRAFRSERTSSGRRGTEGTDLVLFGEYAGKSYEAMMTQEAEYCVNQHTKIITQGKQSPYPYEPDKDFFNHLENAPSELPLMNIVFLGEDGDLDSDSLARAISAEGEHLVCRCIVDLAKARRERAPQSVLATRPPGRNEGSQELARILLDLAVPSGR